MGGRVGGLRGCLVLVHLPALFYLYLSIYMTAARVI